MVYNYFRDYDQARGRYMESDPIGLIGGLNSYGYVKGNPLTDTDFFGLQPDYPYDSYAEARMEMLKDLRTKGINTGNEWTSHIYKLSLDCNYTFWAYRKPSTDGLKSEVTLQDPMDGFEVYEYAHNHPGNTVLSKKDVALAEELNTPMTIVTHDGLSHTYIPEPGDGRNGTYIAPIKIQ